MMPPRGQHRRAASAGGAYARGVFREPSYALAPSSEAAVSEDYAPAAAAAASAAAEPPPATTADAGSSPSRQRRRGTAHGRACAAIRLPRLIAAAVAAVFAAVCLAVPLVFDQAVTGDELWEPFSKPGQYVNVMLLRAQGLPPRPRSRPADAGDLGAVPPQDYEDEGAGGLRNPFIFTTLWPRMSDEEYRTRVANATLTPDWQQEFTFDQGKTRARKVSLQLFDAVGGRAPPLWLGTAMVPVPANTASQVPVNVRQSRLPVADMIEGWFPFFARPEGDYEGAPPPAVAEVYARVSFAARRTHSGYCEEVRLESPIAQPMDSYSNAAFAATGLHMIAVGALDLARARARRRAAAASAATLPLAAAASALAAASPLLSEMEQFPIFSLTNGLVQFYTGLSSFLYHASMTSLGQILDMAGVYMLVTSPSLYMLLRLGAFGPPRAPAAHAAYTAASAACGYAFYAHKWDLERMAGGSTNLVLDLVAVLVTVIALWLWVLGSPGPHAATSAGALSAKAAAAQRSSGGEDEEDTLAPLMSSGGGANGVAAAGAPAGGGGSESSSPLAGGTPRAGGGVFSPRARSAGPDSPGGGSGSPSAAAADGGWLPGLLSLRPLSARAAPGYDLLRVSESSAAGDSHRRSSEDNASPSAAAAAANGSQHQPQHASAGGAPAPLHDAPALVRALGRGAVAAWRGRVLPRALSYRYCIASLFCIMVAYGTREMDVRWAMWCMPRGWFQLHAVWHIMAALSLWCLWVFMRSEAPAGSVSEPLRFRPVAFLQRVMGTTGALGRTRSAGARAADEDGAAAAAAAAAAAGGVGAATPRGLAVRLAAAGGLELPPLGLAPGSARSQSAGAAALDAAAAAAAQEGLLQEGPVGVPAAAGRAAAHLRTRSREVFNLSASDMV